MYNREYDHLTNDEINKKVSELTGYECESGDIPDFCGDVNLAWSLMLEIGIFFEPLAWERIEHKDYRAKWINQTKDGCMANFGTSFYSDHVEPFRAAMLTAIKVLSSDLYEEIQSAKERAQS
ncbi:hypothetical protein [Vibrio sp. D431a]|uniref:hypothetical protein n=1 Tax=Vibrio sp. D431a TaxID=2837388 RepID=UPI00255799D8|nr:hypothetical protein [Vibrio sp. D431a]MDK9789748.1 hypothetical protein [Vibrio sp. D431a]